MKFRPASFYAVESAFTMIEVALCLAIIGLALVAIIGVLPIGMNTQRDTREETTINQDATVLLEAIRNGSRGANDLTNYVYAITNYPAQYNANGSFSQLSPVGYASGSAGYLTNGADIVGLMSAPQFTDLVFNPTNNLLSGGYSNHVVAYVRSLSGLAAEKPPQDNSIMVGDSFTYRIYMVNTAMAMDINSLTNITSPTYSTYSRQLVGNQRELRMTFLWPQLPNGKLGNGHQTFRATIAGQMNMATNNGQRLYFYQSQSFKSQ